MIMNKETAVKQVTLRDLALMAAPEPFSMGLMASTPVPVAMPRSMVVRLLACSVWGQEARHSPTAHFPR